MEGIIITVCISIAIPLVFQLFYFLRAKEEKKYKNENIFRTRMPKAMQMFFLGFAIIFFVLMIVSTAIFIKDKEPLSVVLVVLLVFSLFIALGLVGFCITRFNYEIIEGDEIIIVRCFKKRRRVKFDDIKYYSFVSGFIGSLTGYDKFGIPLMSSDSANIGVEQLVDKFKERNIALVIGGKNFPYNSMKETEEYTTYKKKANLKGYGWIFFGFGLATLFLFSILFPNIHFEEYQNYLVTGIVESYTYDKRNETITIELVGDENIYHVNNIVYEKVSGDFERQLKEKEEIFLYIAYTDEADRLAVSQIEMNGEIYLNMGDAEAAEWKNFHVLKVFCYVDLGIGVVLLVLWLSCLIVLKVKFKNRVE